MTSLNRRVLFGVVMTLTVAPARAGAQNPAAPQAPAQSRPASADSAKYLAEATAILSRIPDKPKGDNADEHVVQLRRHFEAMIKAYRTGAPEPVATSTIDTATDTAAADTTQETLGWKELFSEVERDITAMIGGGTALGRTTAGVAVPTDRVAVVDAAGNPIAVGTAGRAPTPTTPATPGAPAAPGSPQTPTTPGTPIPPTRAPASPNIPGDPTPGANPSAPNPAGGAAGAAQGTPAAEADAAVVGIAATKVSTIGIKDLDPAVRRQLEDFRVQLELFFTSAETAEAEAIRGLGTRD